MAVYHLPMPTFLSISSVQATPCPSPLRSSVVFSPSWPAYTSSQSQLASRFLKISACTPAPPPNTLGLNPSASLTIFNSMSLRNGSAMPKFRLSSVDCSEACVCCQFCRRASSGCVDVRLACGSWARRSVSGRPGADGAPRDVVEAANFEDCVLVVLVG